MMILRARRSGGELELGASSGRLEMVVMVRT